jgi:hypothetical protein
VLYLLLAGDVVNFKNTSIEQLAMLHRARAGIIHLPLSSKVKDEKDISFIFIHGKLANQVK